MSVLRAALRAVQVVAAVGALVFVVALFANEPAPVDRGGPAATETDAGGDAEVTGVDGSAVYSARCASCHGASGQGASGPQLADGRVVERFPDIADQIQVVTGGRGGMPAFEGTLTQEEIEAVVQYTRSL